MSLVFGDQLLIIVLSVAITTADQWLWSFVISRTTPYMITSLRYGTYVSLTKSEF